MAQDEQADRFEEQGAWEEDASSRVASVRDAEQYTSEDTSFEPSDDTVSQPFVGRWNQLVSQTNWEKGRIICQWRTALADSGLPSAAYSDEAWARHVGGVTPQHVGRLRRVFQRFGDVQQRFEGVYWSHFCTALDWDDAEMWLEGVVQNGWSVSDMRRMRRETLGELSAESAVDDQLLQDVDEDFQPLTPVEQSESSAAPAVADKQRAEEDSAGRAESDANADDDVVDLPELEGYEAADEEAEEPAAKVRPFANLPDLPADLSEAFDAFKLAILSHKTAQWQDVSAQDVLAALDALKTLVTAP